MIFGSYKYMILIQKFLISFLFLFSANLFAFKATEHTRISLLTASQGPELYTIFGHNAIRIQDTSQKSDTFFNYGTFNFRTPNFYMKFARGHLLYQLSVEDSMSFMYVYVINGQYVKEQVFDLTLAQKQKICDFIENNYKPENRYYKYDFYYDNCATRLRDIIYLAYDRNLVFPDSVVKQKPRKIRQLLDPYMDAFPWTHLGIDLVMGLPADRITDISQEMFLPEYMLNHLSRAKYNGKPIVSQTLELLPERRVRDAGPWYLQPLAILWTFFLLSLLSFLYLKKLLPVLSKTWFTIWGLLGILIGFMWFFTDHQATKLNLNFFWAFPLHLLVWFPESKFRRQYFKYAVLLISLIVVLWILSIYPQGINPAYLPVWGTMIVLGWNYGFMKKS